MGTVTAVVLGYDFTNSGYYRHNITTFRKLDLRKDIEDHENKIKNYYFI
jgi:hypothetical protein